MAATYEGNLKWLEEKMEKAGLYHTSYRLTMIECARIMTRLHYYNAQHVEKKFRTETPDGKRPPELIALENGSRELLNYLKALGLTVDGKKRVESEKKAEKAASPINALAAALSQLGDDG